MTGPAEDADETSEERGGRLLSEVYVRGGWQRTLPDGGVALFPALAFEGPMTRESLHAMVRPEGAGGGLDASAWEELHQYTDAELASLREEFADGPLAPVDGEAQTAVEVMAEEAASRQKKLADIDRFSDHLGVAPVRTLGDLLDFMVACDLVTYDATDGTYDINPCAPLPSEVLPLSSEEAAAQDARRDGPALPRRPGDHRTVPFWRR